MLCHCNTLQWVAMCSVHSVVFQCVAVLQEIRRARSTCCAIAVCCDVLRYVAVCCGRLKSVVIFSVVCEHTETQKDRDRETDRDRDRDRKRCRHRYRHRQHTRTPTKPTRAHLINSKRQRDRVIKRLSNVVRTCCSMLQYVTMRCSLLLELGRVAD